MKLQLKTNKKIKVSFVLSMITVLTILVELYLAYIYLYPNLNVSDESIQTRDIVRVDLKAYQKTIDLLNKLETYQPGPLGLQRTNPFE